MSEKPLPPRGERIEATLNAAFTPAALTVIDESAAHAGHAGAQPGGETHYRVRMTAPAFTAMTRVQRQRAVMDALKSEFDAGLHALALELRGENEIVTPPLS